MGVGENGKEQFMTIGTFFLFLQISLVLLTN